MLSNRESRYRTRHQRVRLHTPLTGAQPGDRGRIRFQVYQAGTYPRALPIADRLQRERTLRELTGPDTHPHPARVVDGETDDGSVRRRRSYENRGRSPTAGNAVVVKRGDFPKRHFRQSGHECLCCGSDVSPTAIARLCTVSVSCARDAESHEEDDAGAGRNKLGGKRAVR